MTGSGGRGDERPTKVKDANRWKELEIIQPGKGEKDASAPRLLMVVSHKRLNAGEPHNVEQNNLATLLPDLL